jgi:hypothetical protein
MGLIGFRVACLDVRPADGEQIVRSGINIAIILINIVVIAVYGDRTAPVCLN